MSNIREAKQRFTLRKNKRFKNVVSVGLGLFIATAVGVSGNEAKANEIEQPKIMTTENPATNAPESQPKATEEAISSIEKTGEVAGTVDVAVDKSKVDEAVENAKNNGLKVEKEADKDLGTAKSIEEAREKQAEANKDYKNQETEINKKTEEYKKEDEKYKEKKKKVDEANKKLKEDYEKSKLEADQEYKKEDEKYKEEKKKIDNENKKLKEDYEIEKEKAEKSAKKIETSNREINTANAEKKAEYEKKEAEYNKLKLEYDKEVKEAEANKTKDGYLKEPTIQNFNFKREPNARVSIIGGTPINEENMLKAGWKVTNVVDNGYESSRFINDYYVLDAIGGNYERISSKKYNQLHQQSSYVQSDYFIALAKKDTPILATYTGLKNTTYKNRAITKAIYEYTVTKVGGRGEALLIIHDDPTETAWMKGQWWDESDSITPDKEMVLKVKPTFYYEDGTKVEFEENDPAVFSFASLNGFELPNGSMSEKVKFNGKMLAINGSSLTKHNDGWIYSDTNNNNKEKGSKFNGAEYDYRESGKEYYAATAGIIPTGDFEFEIATTAGIWFSFNSEVKAKGIIPPYEPVPPKEPKYEKEITDIPQPVKPPKYNPYPDPPKPREVTPPKYEDDPKAPEVPTVKYHYVTFDVEPNVYKEVKNVEGTNINNNLVSKLSTVNWELKTEDLPVNRERIKSYKITDYLPSGFEINLENTKELSKGFNVVFDKSTNTAIFTADKDTLMLFNKDLTKEIKPIYPIASGIVLNDGATYENNFRLDVELEKEYVGNVFINYVDTKGNTISKTVTDIKDGKVGTTYNTTDNKPLEIAYNGELYTITTTVKGNEMGEVVKGNIEVTYVYDKLEPKENTGSVVIHYVDTKGKTIKNDVVDTKEKPTGTDYDTKDNKPNEIITKDNVTYKITTTVKGNETGKVTNGVTEVTYVYERTTPEKPGKSYTRYSNKVVVYTPGNDPKKPRPPFPTVPGEPGENPTPNDNLINPEKENLNKDGVDINGTVVPLNSTNYYVLKWDLDQYKGIKASAEDIAKGFYYIDDYPEEALNLNEKEVKIVDSTGKAVVGVKVESFESVETATGKIKEMLEKAKITPKGAFQLFTAENPEEFFNTYVVKGNSLSITTPMTVKEELKGKDTVYINKGHQVDFGNGYYTNEVENKVITPNPEKENLNKDGININGKQLVVGMVNNYTLTWDLSKYKGIKSSKEDIAKGFYFVDDYPEEALEINENEVTLVDSKGQAVTGVSISTISSTNELPENLKEKLSKNKLVIKGAFQLFRAENPEEFYNKYVTTGETIKIISPMVVKDSLKGKTAEYKNKAFQMDYDNIFETKVVPNKVVTPNPEKENLNKDGVDINGTPVAIGSTNYFTMKWDLDQYKGIEASKEDIAKGFYFIDDYPEEAVTINKEKVKVTDSKGEVVRGISVNVYNSVDELDSTMKEVLSKNKVVIKGAFQLFKADNPEEFYNTYVKTGETITIVDPMTVKEELKGKNVSYENKAYQSDFGNVILTEIVGNHVPKVDPEKENLNKDGININGTPMYVGAVNNYTLTWDLDQYKGIKASKEDVSKGFYFIDDYPEEALEINVNGITLVDSRGKAVTGVKVEAFESLEKATEEAKAILSSVKITPKGAFQLFRAENAEQFYNDYVTKGISITITNPMVVKKAFAGDYENKAFQVDFGNGYETDVIVNNVPKVEPKKENLNEKGVNIDGKTLLPNSVNYYKLTWDLDQYKGIKASKEDVSKGFYFVDDYPEEALEINENGITLVDSTGQAVVGVKVEAFESVEKATDEVKAILSSVKITPKGAFQLFRAENPEQFYNDYVTKGLSITITNPMTVKGVFTGDYENKAFQVDFGNGYETDVVVNNVPKLDPQKDVVIDVTNKDNSLDGKEIELGKVRSYNLVGSKLPANRGEEIKQYGFYDDYDQTGDQYDGVYLAFATVDVTLKDGTVIKKGTEITKYTTQNIDTKDGKVSIELDKVFLEKVSLDSEFQADVFLQFKRISSGTFKNTFINTINSYEVSSNTVVTNTPEPPKPEEPKKPEPPKPEEPKKPTPPSPEKPKKLLPKTSAATGKEQNNNAGALASGLVTLGVLTLVRKRKVK